MKKYLALFLAALMLLSLAAGCALTGSDTQTDKPETSPNCSRMCATIWMDIRWPPIRRRRSTGFRS